MSLEIQAKIICDGCGIEVLGTIQTTSSRSGGMRAYWSAMDQCEKLGWVRNLRYGPARHYCATCADKAPQPQPVAAAAK